MTVQKRPITVEIRPTLNPEGEPAVLLQFENGWMVITPSGARKLAALLMNVADEVEES